MPNLWTPDDVTTTATLEVWRDKLSREERCAQIRCARVFPWLAAHSFRS